MKLKCFSRNAPRMDGMTHVFGAPCTANITNPVHLFQWQRRSPQTTRVRPSILKLTETVTHNRALEIDR